MDGTVLSIAGQTLIPGGSPVTITTPDAAGHNVPVTLSLDPAYNLIYDPTMYPLPPLRSGEGTRAGSGRRESGDSDDQWDAEGCSEANDGSGESGHRDGNKDVKEAIGGRKAGEGGDGRISGPDDNGPDPDGANNNVDETQPSRQTANLTFTESGGTIIGASYTGHAGNGTLDAPSTPSSSSAAAVTGESVQQDKPTPASHKNGVTRVSRSASSLIALEAFLSLLIVVVGLGVEGGLLLY